MNPIIRFRQAALACFAVLLLAGAARAQFLLDGNETTMSSSGNHACAIAAGGRVKCWGLNQGRKLGNNSASGGSNRPVNVLAANGVGLLTGATAISVAFTSCAIVGGAVMCWGDTLAGAAAAETPLPTQIPGLAANATALSVTSSRGCAVVLGGVKCWGDNINGNLGVDPAATPESTVAVDVTGLGAGAGATRVAIGLNHSCAIVNGGVKCWGSAPLIGKVIGGSFTFTPVDVTGLGAGSNVVSLGVTGGTTCAVLGTSGVDAQMKCWGTGPVGDGSTGAQVTPVVVPHPVAGSSWGQAAQGGSSGGSVCARENFGISFGGIYCWGSGTNGRLGRNDIAASNTPVRVAQSGFYRAAIGGGSSNCLLDSDGAARCWGSNSFGELGTGENIEHWAPVRVFTPRCTMDLDGNGLTDALTDGLLNLRVLFGLTGTAVTAGAVAPGAPRSTWASIRDYLRAECDAQVAN